MFLNIVKFQEYPGKLCGEVLISFHSLIIFISCDFEVKFLRAEVQDEMAINSLPSSK